MRFVTVAQHPNFSTVANWCLLALVIQWCVLVTPTCGQDISATALPQSSQRKSTQRSSLPVPAPEVLPRESAELEIALGRIRLVPDRFRIVRKHEQFDWPVIQDTASSTSSTSNATNGSTNNATNNSTATAAVKNCSRSMQVAAQEGRPTVKLSYTDPIEKWTLSVDNIVGAEWTRELLDSSPVIKVTYVQRPHQPIAITIDGVSKQPIKLSSLTLWHLTEQNSAEFVTYVLPALVRLNPTWDLPQALAAAKRMRGYGEFSNSSAAKHELAQSIAELDSVDRRVREAAKQKLREAGLAAQIPLEKLRGGPLSSQQRSTVEELLGELEPRSADTPTRIAYWLSGDPNWR